jgi:hypothetical protein
MAAAKISYAIARCIVVAAWQGDCLLTPSRDSEDTHRTWRTSKLLTHAFLGFPSSHCHACSIGRPAFWHIFIPSTTCYLWHCSRLVQHDWSQSSPCRFFEPFTIIGLSPLDWFVLHSSWVSTSTISGGVFYFDNDTRPYVALSVLKVCWISRGPPDVAT